MAIDVYAAYLVAISPLLWTPQVDAFVASSNTAANATLRNYYRSNDESATTTEAARDEMMDSLVQHAYADMLVSKAK